ncbi:MAG: transmembrane sensor [Crocinitomix sp.]|jgi:transmembrane sensor
MSRSENDIEDETLGRWLAGDLTPEELEAFEKSDAYATYKSIANYSAQLEAPEYNTEAEYERLQNKLNTPVIKMNRTKFFGIIAGVAALLIIGLFFLIPESNVKYATVQGETEAIFLPDSSQINLNVSSSIEYNKSDWEDERTINLEGEGYFKVTKGNRFTVITNHGTVEVLGTEFNIRNRNSITEIVCYEGKVNVKDLHGTQKILSIGDVARIENGTLENDWSPTVTENAEWINGFSSFHDVPFENVIKELENQYKLTVDCKVDISNRTYVGAFPHDNLEQALRLIFEPMQLAYKATNNELILVE